MGCAFFGLNIIFLKQEIEMTIKRKNSHTIFFTEINSCNWKERSFKHLFYSITNTVKCFPAMYVRHYCNMFFSVLFILLVIPHVFANCAWAAGGYTGYRDNLDIYEGEDYWLYSWRTPVVRINATRSGMLDVSINTSFDMHQICGTAIDSVMVYKENSDDPVGIFKYHKIYNSASGDYYDELRLSTHVRTGDVLYFTVPLTPRDNYFWFVSVGSINPDGPPTSPDRSGIVHIYFDPQGGHAFVTERVSSAGGKYGRMPDPYWGYSKVKHTFLGWFTAPEGGKQVKEGDKLAFNYDHTLYAHWALVEQPAFSKTVTIHLDAQGGTCYIKSLFSSTGGTYKGLPTPYWNDTQQIQTFLGWYTQPTGGVQVKNGDMLAYNSDHTLYAHWSETPAPEISQTVVIHLNPQGGTCFGTTIFSVTNGQYENLPTPYWRKDLNKYEFQGWFTAPEGGKQVKDGDMLAYNSDHTLYAHWSETPAPEISQTVVIHLNPQGGTCFGTTIFSVTNGQYENLPTPYWRKDLNKYEFQGWFTAPEGGKQVKDGDMLAYNSDHTLYAHWGEQTKKTTIVVTIPNTGTRTDTYIPADELSEALAESYDLSTPSVTIQTEYATVSYDAEGLQAISDQLEAQGELDALGQDARMSQENEQSIVWNIEMAALYTDVEGTMHSAPVHDLGSGHMMVTVDYEKPENWDEDNLVVYRLDDNGNIVEELPSSYSSINDTMSWISSAICQFLITNKTTTPETVEDKVSIIAQECRNAGIAGEWEIALWLHDWLIYHATYDYSLSFNSPTGVLLVGTGVSQSYSEAYALLLDAFQIQNVVVVAPEMDHAWNLVRLEGEWCNIDCTWDDPGFGGAENHTYFGMNDDLLARDHRWNRDSYSVSTSLQNYYPIRNGELVFSDMGELETILDPVFTAKENMVFIQYIGSNPEQSAYLSFEEWYSKYNWKYGILNFSATYTNYSCTVYDIVYTEPWEKPSTILETPVSAPDFQFNDAESTCSLSDYAGMGLMLVYGKSDCPNTLNLLGRLESKLSELNDADVEVLVHDYNAETVDDLEVLREEYPLFHYVYGRTKVWEYLRAVSYQQGGVVYPCVFIINREGKIIYYTTAFVYNVDELMSEAYSVSGGNPVQPHIPDESKMFNVPAGTGEIGSEAFDGIAAETIYIPASVEHIRSGAFANCQNLKKIIFANGNLDVAEDFVSGCPLDLVIEAPEGSTVANNLELYFRYICPLPEDPDRPEHTPRF